MQKKMKLGEHCVACSLPNATDTAVLRLVERLAASATGLVLTELHPMEETGLQSAPGVIRILRQVAQQLEERR
jgi:hypothetical protein